MKPTGAKTFDKGPVAPKRPQHRQSLVKQKHRTKQTNTSTNTKPSRVQITGNAFLGSSVAAINEIINGVTAVQSLQNSLSNASEVDLSSMTTQRRGERSSGIDATSGPQSSYLATKSNANGTMTAHNMSDLVERVQVSLLPQGTSPGERQMRY